MRDHVYMTTFGRTKHWFDLSDVNFQYVDNKGGVTKVIDWWDHQAGLRTLHSRCTCQ